MGYITRTDIEAVFDEANITQWADLGNSGVTSTIDARIARAIAYAESRVDSFLRGGPYQVPVVKADGTVPYEIVDISAKLAAVWLYELRGNQDATEEGGQHRLAKHKKDAEQMLTAIKGCAIRLDAVMVDVLYPQAVEDED